MTTYNVPADGTLQAVINLTARGDTINVALGTYSTAVPLSLANKSGSFNGTNYITIQSASVASLPSRRVGVTDTALMPRLQVTASGVNLMEVTGTGWKLIGLELTNKLTTIASSADLTPSMCDFDGVAADMVVDRCVVHPEQQPSIANNYLTTGRYAFNVRGNRFSAPKSYIYNFFGRDATDVNLQGVVASQQVLGISTTNPAVITYSGSPAVNTGDTIQVIFAGAMENYFRPGGVLTGDFTATAIDATHFSVPVNLTSAEAWNPANTRTAFYRWPRMSSITLGNPTQITMSGVPSLAPALATGQKVRPRGLDGTLGSALNGNDYTITVINPTTFTIPVNTTGLSIYSGSGGYYKAEGSAQQTIGFGVGADVQDFSVVNTYVQAWYATMQSAASDADPTLTTTVNPSPTPTASDIFVASTTGITAGMLIAVDTTHFDDPAKCPFGGQGGDRPCFGFGIVGSVNSGTGQVHFSTPIKIKNAFGVLVSPTAAIIGPVNITGYNPTNITMNYNSMDIPYEFASFHYVSNGNTGKGVIEGKDATNAHFEGNIITGFPSTFALTSNNQNGSSPWMSTFNSTIRNNWFKAFRSAILNSFVDYNARTTQGHGLIVDNNLFNGGIGFNGTCFALNSPTTDITLTHNTCTNGYVTGATSIFTSFSTGDGTDPYYPVAQVPNVIYRDNILDAGYYVTACYMGGAGQAHFANCFNSPALTFNGFAKTYAGSDPMFQFTDPSNEVVESWSAAGFVGSNVDVITDWALSPTSPFFQQGSGGSDMGVNIAQLITALRNNDGFALTGGGGTVISGAVVLSGPVTI